MTLERSYPNFAGVPWLLTILLWLASASASQAAGVDRPTASATGPSHASAEDAALRHARELLKKHPLIDGHNDLPNVIREKGSPLRDVEAYDLSKRAAHDTDLERLRQGGVGAQFWAVWVPSTADVTKLGAARIQLEQIDITRRMIERYPKDLRLALTAADIERANRDGYIASLLGIEGGHTLENSLGALRTYYWLGVRYMTLTHFKGHDWADSATDLPKHGGLTRFGQEVVREMNRLGMLVDLSHVSADTMNDVLDIAEAPVIFSHSNARALTDIPRNVPDQVLRRVPGNGGLVMAAFVSPFNAKGPAYDAWQAGFAKASGGVALGDANYEQELAKYQADHPEPRATIQDVADHIEHLRKVAGVDHVGLGSDFFGEEIFMAAGLEDTSRYPHLLAELIRRGWSDDDLIKLARGNLLRVLKLAEQVAGRLQRARPASYITIEELDGGRDKPNLY
ncbi:MAG: dipeptidase [Luteimonas sp.]